MEGRFKWMKKCFKNAEGKCKRNMRKNWKTKHLEVIEILKKSKNSKEINQLVVDAISYGENKRKLYKTEKEEIEDLLGGD